MIRKIFSVSFAVVLILAMLWASGETAQADTVKIGIVAEMSGAGARVGVRWERGILLAVEEINASGGLLGKKIETYTLDTKTEPPVSVAAMKKAIEQKPFVIMGTVYSSSTIVNMGILQQAGIPQIVGSEATGVTQKGNPNIFRTSYSTFLAMKKLARYILEGFNTQKLAVIYSNDTFGKSGRDAIAELTEGKAQLVGDIATEVGQTDFTGEIARLQRSGADTLYFQVHEEEGARMMMQIKEAGLKINCATYGTDITHIADLAKSDADGLVGIDLPAEALPIMPLNKKYEAKYGEEVDAEAVKGYVGTYVVKATVEKVGSFDQQKFRDTLHNSTIYAKDEPGVLMDISYDENGDIDRISFLVEIKNGKVTIKETLPPLKK